MAAMDSAQMISVDRPYRAMTHLKQDNPSMNAGGLRCIALLTLA